MCVITGTSHHLQAFFFFLNTTYEHKGEENERKIAENFQKQPTLNSEPKPSWLNHLTTYGDFFFSIFFFGTTYRHKHEENEGEPSWQHEDLIKNHRNEAADHRKNQEATKNSPTHTYGDFFFQFFFSVRVTDANMTKTEVSQADTTKIW